MQPMARCTRIFSVSAPSSSRRRGSFGARITAEGSKRVDDGVDELLLSRFSVLGIIDVDISYSLQRGASFAGVRRPKAVINQRALACTRKRKEPCTPTIKRPLGGGDGGMGCAMVHAHSAERNARFPPRSQGGRRSSAERCAMRAMQRPGCEAVVVDLCKDASLDEIDTYVTQKRAEPHRCADDKMDLPTHTAQACLQ